MALALFIKTLTCLKQRFPQSEILKLLRSYENYISVFYWNYEGYNSLSTEFFDGQHIINFQIFILLERFGNNKVEEVNPIKSLPFKSLLSKLVFKQWKTYPSLSLPSNLLNSKSKHTPLWSTPP